MRIYRLRQDKRAFCGLNSKAELLYYIRQIRTRLSVLGCRATSGNFGRRRVVVVETAGTDGKLYFFFRDRPPYDINNNIMPKHLKIHAKSCILITGTILHYTVTCDPLYCETSRKVANRQYHFVIPPK